MDKKLTVTQLNNYIKGVFEDELILRDVTVCGEISEFKTAAGNTYITLKDGDNTLNCVYFMTAAGCETGQKAELRGGVRFYPKSGRVSFIVTSIKVVGEGLSAAALAKIKQQLLDEGVFSNRRSLPCMIMRLALITSAEGAVVHDMLKYLQLTPYIDVKLFATRVQGMGALEQILGTLTDIGCGKFGNFDAIVIARGGGSQSDLNVFNDATLARKVHESSTVVISAVGHEVDYTLCDYAADIRTGTPSMAGELIVKNNFLYFDRLKNAVILAGNSVTKLLDRRTGRLRRATESGFYALSGKNQKAFRAVAVNALKIQNSTIDKLNKKQRAFTVAVRRAEDAVAGKVAAYKNKLGVLAAVIEGHNPAAILAKGYAKIYRDGTPLGGVGQLSKGDNIKITMADGGATATVSGIDNKN